MAFRRFVGMMEQWIGPKGPRYLPLVGTLVRVHPLQQLLGLVPGFMAPTSSINVTLGCALTIWVYYHFQGIQRAGRRQLHEALCRASGIARRGWRR